MITFLHANSVIVHEFIVIWGGASENNIKPISTVVNKIIRIIVHVKQDGHNIPEIGTS